MMAKPDAVDLPVAPQPHSIVSKKTRTTIVVIAVVFILVLAGIEVITNNLSYVPLNPTPAPQHVSNVFVDVNSDGRVDLIVSGEVVFNAGNNQNLPLSQPTQKP